MATAVTGPLAQLHSMKAQNPFLDLGETDKLLGFFYIGVVAIPSVAGKRRPIEEKVEWVRG